MRSPQTARSPLHRPVGDHGPLVEFGETITQETHALALRFDAALSAKTFEGFRGGPVAIYVGIDWRVFGRHEAIRSCGEVNDLIVWFLGEGLPSVDLAHGDLS